jgi:hypothetical protein
MPTKGLRYTNKVDLEKEAATDKFLHVRSPGSYSIFKNNY